MKRRFLFGQPVLPAKPVAKGPRDLFVLGAYPSALHVRWFSPKRDLLIQAVAIDNEPEPFWTGDDQGDRIEVWRDAVGFSDDWGRVETCGHLNGPSGDWVQSSVIEALGFTRGDTWITDCLDTYFESDAAAKSLDSEPVSRWVKLLGIPPRCHSPHPTESEIVGMALEAERCERLVTELEVASPKRVVTLGNAALRVFSDLVDSAAHATGKLSVDSYGEPIAVSVRGRDIEWIPLAHPAAPAAYQEAHKAWISSRKSSV